MCSVGDVVEGDGRVFHVREETMLAELGMDTTLEEPL